MAHRLLLGAVVQLGYLITGLLAGVITFSVTVVLLFVGLLLIPVGLGFRVLAVTARVVGGLAVAERARANLLLAADLVGPSQPRVVEGRGRERWRQSWSHAWLQRELAYCLLLLPAALGASALVLPLWSAGLVGVLSPLYAVAVPNGDLFPWWAWPSVAERVVGFAAGLAVLLAARSVTGALTTGLLRFASSRLSPHPEDALQARISHLTRSRAGVADAADAERRRIERDLHDGAQSHLVALAMNLGRAKSKFDHDPHGARLLVEQAHEEAKESITALRHVVQGLHPPVLTDRGLDAALSTLAARTPIPVRLVVELPDRPDPTVEAIAYFVVSEALTNTARHADAGSVHVRVHGTPSDLTLMISDDGRGGATERPGGGLRGLRERVDAVDGTVEVASPVGHGTTITVRMPHARRDR